ncbi:MAG: SulP family inorganic anion transporter [Clostridia bacterium]|nr:SulP family inorganic anion transporter [Clostridia bacterium]
MFIPKLFQIIKESPQDLKGKNLANDIVAGLIVAVVALPLSIALAISSGVSPEVGLITAIVAGFLISFLGGSRVQIGGPTAAFVVIICGIIEQYGVDGLIIATIMAGAFLIVFGLLKLGDVIKFIPFPITVGFTTGIAVTLFSTQLNDFLGMNISGISSEFIPKWGTYIQNLDKIDLWAGAIGVGSIVISVVWGKINKKIPGSLIALIVTTIAVMIMQKNGIAESVQTIGSKFTDLKGAMPLPHLPDFKGIDVAQLIQPALTIAILAGIESLLSAVVADGMTGDKHNSNQELIAQGIANIGSALFGGLPATGAIARTAANIRNGGRTPIAGMVHAVVLLIIMLVAMPLAKLIPMPTLAGILIVVSWNMCEFKEFAEIARTTKSDMAILIITFILTVVFDLVIAIEIGMVMAMFLFMKKMSESFNINTVSKEHENDTYKYINNEIMVYELAGPMFFGASTRFMDVMKKMNVKSDVLILRMTNVPIIDGTSLDSLHYVIDYAKQHHILVLYAELQPQPLKVLKKFGCEKRMGKERFFATMDEAYAFAQEIVTISKENRKNRTRKNKVEK